MNKTLIELLDELLIKAQEIEDASYQNRNPMYDISDVIELANLIKTQLTEEF